MDDISKFPHVARPVVAGQRAQRVLRQRESRLEKVMGERLPTIGIGQPIALAVELLDTAPALVVLAGGRPRAVLGRADVLEHLSRVS